jgi:hypothetical protein
MVLEDAIEMDREAVALGNLEEGASCLVEA